MSSPFANAVTAAHAAIAAAAGETVIYARGASAVQLVAVPGQTTAEQQTHTGLHAQINIVDFLIDVGDLVLGGSPIEPKAGDRIYRQSGNGATQWLQYEVSPLDARSQPWRHSDPGRRRYRIHTKLIRTVIADSVPGPVPPGGGDS